MKIEPPSYRCSQTFIHICKSFHGL